MQALLLVLGTRTVFAYRVGSVEMLDAPWVENGKFVREIAPADKHSLAHLTRGGKPQWPQVITTTGKYFWIPPERVLLLEFHKAKRPRDLFWRRATMQVADGPDGEVYLPALYPPTTGTAAAMTDALRLGRATDWHQAGDGGPTLGLGAVTILVGEEASEARLQAEVLGRVAQVERDQGRGGQGDDPVEAGQIERQDEDHEHGAEQVDELRVQRVHAVMPPAGCAPASRSPPAGTSPRI